MDFNIAFTNVWLLFVLGYGLVWIYMIRVNKKRGKEIEDPDEHKQKGKKWKFITGFLPTLILLFFSLFIPIVSGVCLIIGIFLYLFGITINLIALTSFIKQKKELNTSGIYSYSRNPMYVGGMFFIAGLNLINCLYNIMSLIFLLFSLVWIITVYMQVLQEEKFLINKYGQAYEEYLKIVPRYVGFVKKARREKHV